MLMAPLNSFFCRLGSEIGPLYIACYDVFSNRMPFKTYPQPQIEVRRMGKPLGIKIEKARGSLTQDRMHLQISKILLGRGNLESLRPSYEASLWIGSQDSRYVEMPIAVLPGELCSVKILGGQTLENCLRPGDVIPELSLEFIAPAFGAGTSIHRTCIPAVAVVASKMITANKAQLEALCTCQIRLALTLEGKV
eukprot:Gb_24285 [translate_table: standard]